MVVHRVLRIIHIMENKCAGTIIINETIQYVSSKDEHVSTLVRIIRFADWRFYENNGAGLWLSYSWCGN